MQTSKSGAIYGQDFDQRDPVIRHIGRGIEEIESLGIHPAPQKRLSFQNSELPCPWQIRIAKALVLTIGVFLALFQIAAKESLGITVKGTLRALSTMATKPAG